MNLNYMKHALLAENLDTAMHFAYKTAKTDKVIVFDGATGGINLSRPLAEHLLEVAPAVNERVDNTLLPRWLEQRAVDMRILGEIA